MICCKIVTNYQSDTGSFSKLFNALAARGDVLWENSCLYFGNTDEACVDEKFLVKMLRKAGYPKFYINVYDFQNQPHESDYINGWLYDKIVKINYKKCEDECQSLFKDISTGLDILDYEIARLQKTNAEEAESG